MLGDGYRPHRRRKRTPGRQAMPELIEGMREMPLEVGERFLIDARRALMRLHPFLGVPHHPCGNTARLCCLHWFLPCLVDQPASCTIHPLRSTPMPGASSLRRGGPPLCPASVRSRLWGLHVRLSLAIRATGSHVPHTSLDHSHAIFRPDATQPVSRLPLGSSWSNAWPQL